jgi:regulator of cell morphogenesis and NO signaling
MSAIESDTKLGDLVVAHPELARELERRGLDYCCGGRRSMAAACREAGLDPDAVLADLAAATATEEPEVWANLDVAALADHIERVHHQYLWNELPRLTALIDKVVNAHGARHPDLYDVRDVFAELRADLEPHLIKEERVLFPMIRELTTAERRPEFHCGRIVNPISMMMLEHDRAGDLLNALHTATGAYHVPDDACASYQACMDGLAALESDTRLHIHKENNVLFPAAARLEQELPAT